MNLYASNLPGSPEPHKADWLIENFLALQTNPELAQCAASAAAQTTAGSSSTQAADSVPEDGLSLHVVA